MVDVKRDDITLQDWTKGISADEFAWGSYFYSEAISSGYNTKWFELWYRTYKSKLNERENGNVVSLAPIWWNWFTAFTRDGRIEMQDYWNAEVKWAYYSYNPWGYIGYWYVNGIAYWDKFYAIRPRCIDIIDSKEVFDEYAQLLANTDLSSTTWWTFGTGWTATTSGAEHTTWETDTLVSDSIGDYTSTDRFRLAIKITNWTDGNITVQWWNAQTETYSDEKDGWYVANLGWWTAMTITITPDSDFDWTIELVELYQYDSTKFTTISLQWASTDNHPALIWEWDMYVACEEYMNIINLRTNSLTYKRRLIDDNFRIVAMNQQAWSIIIWATNGYDSRQYYWNGVDSVASEVIEWKWLIIQWATWTETVSYVLTTSGAVAGSVEWYEYRLYIVNWYQRNLIASKLYQFGSGVYLESEHYNENKKFDFNDVTNDQWMIVFLDSLYIPWCDWIYKYGYDIPWMRTAWTRPIKYDTWATNIVVWQRGNFLGMAFVLDWVNYIWEVDNRLYAPHWFLITESIYWDKLSTRKAIEKMKIWFKNVASTVGNIKVYAIVDDTYFWRFRPTTTPTNRPSVWDIYEVAHNTTWKVISVDKTEWVITFITEQNLWSRAWLANTTLTKVSGEWDDSISVGYDYDNMCLIKTIESEQQWYGSDLIFGKNFVNNYIPYWHKIQFVIELNSNSSYLSPEIYELSMVSDITDITL